MNQLRAHFLSFWCSLALLLFAYGESYAQDSSQGRPLSQIIQQIESETKWRFLYREALITGISIPQDIDQQNPIQSLNEQLSSYQLTIRVDSSYNQAILVKLQASGGSTASSITISGQVVDASTGERLPFASITWNRGDELTGISANSSGSFRFQYQDDKATLRIRCSYVGYLPKTLELPADSASIEEVTFRLEPQRVDANELIVTGANYYDAVNEHSSALVDIGPFSPLGSSNSIRALQSLPSTSLTPALSGDIHVRGSPADGFHVTLDGITIFNQSHLFGLLDSFNADVLQRSGFFYDIAPAQYQAPPGGTLSMVTQTGPLNDFSATVGASNTSYRLTLEGPLQEGKSSWLLSGRGSYLNAVNWLNNSDLIQWGLNVDRPREILQEDLVNIETELERPGTTDASFFDLHGKLYFENKSGSRFIISGYYGGDRTEQQAERLYRSFQSTRQNMEFREVQTENNWANGAGSVQYQNRLSDQVYMHATAGISVYSSEFKKDDFAYTQINRDNNTFQLFTFPFENQSILNEIKAEQQFDIELDPLLITAGASYNYYLGEYFENSFDRPGFLTTRESHKIDLYAQLEYSPSTWYSLSAGSRLHYYANGDYLRWSPRIKLRLLPDSPVSFGGGYSRNFQFLNKISLSNTVTSDVWILTNADHPPTEVDYFSAGIYLEPTDWLYAQVEGYHKSFEHIRLHEINALSLTNTFGAAPWYASNSGTGRGIEMLLRNPMGPVSLTQTFTISEILLSNPDINGGEPFHADWDRTYQYAASVESEPLANLHLYLAWIYASAG